MCISRSMFLSSYFFINKLIIIDTSSILRIITDIQYTINPANTAPNIEITCPINPTPA